MDCAVNLISQTLQAAYCGILEFVADGGIFLLNTGCGWENGVVGNATITATKESLAGYLLATNESVAVSDTASESRFEIPALFHDWGVRSCAAVLIKGEQRPLGLLIALSKTEQSFAGGDITFMESAANVLAAASERARTEAALRIQALMLESLAEGVNVTDENGFIYYTNPAYDEMFGYPRGELIGKHVSALSPGSDEEDTLKVLNIIERLSRNGIWFGEIENHRRDGTGFTTYARVNGLRMAGRRYWIGIREDITDRKRAEEALRVSEERYRSLVENAPVWIHEMDMDGVVTSVNDAGLKLTGETNKERVHNRSFVEFVAPEEQEIVRGYLERAGQGLQTEFEFWGAGQGERRRVASCIVPIKGADGRAMRLVGISQDVTERRRAEQSLRQYANLLTLLRGIDIAILSARSTRQIAQAAVERVADLVPCQAASILGIDPAGGADRCLAAWGVGAEREGPNLVNLAAFPETWSSLGRGEAVRIIRDSDPDVPNRELVAELRSRGVHSYICVPLLFQDELMGTLNLSSTEPDVFDAEHLEIAREIAYLLRCLPARATERGSSKRAGTATGSFSQADGSSGG
jgi:PAS domain S-box-containing protein